MQVEINDKASFLELGDVIRNENKFYLVMKHGDEYVAKNIATAQGGLFGAYPSLEELNEGFSATTKGSLRDAEVFKSNQYKLILTKI